MKSSSVLKSVGDYVLEEPLFLDSYSTSFRGVHNQTKEEVLIRQFSLATLSQIQNGYQLVSDEISLLKKFSHPNISKIITFYPSKNNFYLVYEGANQGNLENYLKLNRFIPEYEVVRNFKDILNAYG